MSDQTPTPRTDDAIRRTTKFNFMRAGLCADEYKGDDLDYVTLDFARQLERELTQAIAERDEARRERDDAQAKVKDLQAYRLWYLHGWRIGASDSDEISKITGELNDVTSQRDAALAQVAELREWRNEAEGKLVECGKNIGQLCGENEKLRARVERLMDSGSTMLVEIGKLFWTSSDGSSVRDGTPEDSDAPLSFTAAWKSFQAALTGEKGDK